MVDLKQKQENFVIHYYKTGNATQSALMAGYSPNGAEVQGCVLLKNPKVIERLKEVREAGEYSILARKKRLKELAEEDNPAKYGHQRTANIQAIAELNKMDGVYSEERKEAQVTQVVINMPSHNDDSANLIEEEIIEEGSQ